jgi:type II secretory pathway component PulF
MAIYEYTARDATGAELQGTYANVDNPAALRDELTKLGYQLISARRQRQQNRRLGRVSQRDVAGFAYKFASMYGAGLPVLRCLEALEAQTASAALKEVVGQVRRRVETGSSLKQAFEPHRGLFSDFFLGMVEAGESAGRLAESLEMSAEHLDKRLAVREKTRAAFVYPLIVGAICTLVVLALIIFVVPTFSQLYQRMHVELPGPTQVLLALSFLLRRGWWALLGGGAVAVFGFRYLVRQPTVNRHWERFKSRIPVLGPLGRLVSVSQFVRTFGMLISVGVPVIEALDVAANVANHWELSQVTPELKKATRAGRSVAQSLAEHAAFPPVVGNLVASGEEAGILPEMLGKSADLLDRDIDRLTAALIVKLEPALTVVLGGIIGLILMGVYLPMFDYMACLE